MEKKEVQDMKIKWIESKNLSTGLVIEKIDFNKDLTLLVGLSGAGKTQILETIKYSISLATDKRTTLRPFDTSVSFVIKDNEYEWKYRIEQNVSEKIMSDEKQECIFVEEKLYINGNLAIKRNGNDIKIIGYEKVPTPKKDESVLLQYAEEKMLGELSEGLKKLYPIDMEINVRSGLDKESFLNFKNKVSEIMSETPNMDFSFFGQLFAGLKIYVAKNYYEELYIKMFSEIKELFMEIEDIDFLEDVDEGMFAIAMKVYGKTIMQKEISNGMLKTINYIVELYTMNENSLVLIDEFENGLGVNCIDILSEMLINERKDLQFIITSHHPKILNGIDKSKWIIVDRSISTVKNYTSEQYGIGNSQHDAYFNLINRWEFEGRA